MRKLASVRRISEIRPIPEADAIECAVIDGWTVVVKKGEYEVDDQAIYCEIDSWIPTELAPFLSKGQEPREYNGVKGERLKTIKLRGQLSQGLLLPTSIAEWKIAPGEPYVLEDGSDVTELLGIQKWEAPVSAQLAGVARGNFPTAIPKTDQERIQNLKRKFEEWKTQPIDWEITEKLDGSSCTFYLDTEGVFHVCSRNLDLKESEGNSFWGAARKYNVEQGMRDLNLFGVAIQGELIGEGIQGNKYGIKGHEFHVFDVYDAVGGSYMVSEGRQKIAADLGLKHCPVINPFHRLQSTDTIEFLLEYAEFKSQLNIKAEREGVVFKCLQDPNVSFKVISNRWLLKTGE